MPDVTVILNAITVGAAKTEALLSLVYGELRQLAATRMQNEPPGLTLQATALVHEAFLRLVGENNATWDDRRHFLGAAAIAMQRIMVELARQRRQLKRGGKLQRVELHDGSIKTDLDTSDEDLLALDDAISIFEAEDSTKAEVAMDIVLAVHSFHLGSPRRFDALMVCSTFHDFRFGGPNTVWTRDERVV